MNFVLFSNVVEKDLGLIVYICLMSFLFAHSPCETLLFDDSVVQLHDFTHRKNNIVHYFPHRFHYICLHGFVMRGGIVFDSMLAQF